MAIATSQLNQFRRLVGDYGKEDIAEETIESYLNDATYELTMDFVNTSNLSAPVAEFEDLSPQYKPEVIVYAAIQYLWNRLAQLAGKHSKAVGSASQDLGEQYDRVLRLIEKLEARYDLIQQLGTDITQGNISRFSKITLTRLGGRREEEARDDIDG